MKIRAAIAVSAGVLLFGGVALAAHAQSAASDHPKTAGEQFKNVQVLKDVPADQLIPAMQFITASLGVDCEFCHVERAFDKDDKKPKLAARKMMEMMMNINKENFDAHREVTCYSCHRGAAKPVAVPIITAEVKMPEMMAGESMAASSLPKPEELLDKYLAAVGGAGALEKIKTRVEKGTITAFGNKQFPIEIYSKAPDMRISITHFAQGESVTAFNGKVGWLQVPGRVHMMNSQENAEARIDADMAFAVDVIKMYVKFSTREGEQVDGHDTWLVMGRNEGQPPLRLYLDKTSGLLVRMERYLDSPLGYNPTQIDYADYRDNNGVKIPYKWTVARPNNRFTVQVAEVQDNVPVEDAKFAVPPPPAPPAH